jgi:hypothetical protein
MNNQAWIWTGVTPTTHDNDIDDIDFVLCNLNGALSSFTKFSRCDRSRMPTLDELQSDVEEDFEKNEQLEFGVLFGDRPTEKSSESKRWLTAVALKPSGYDILLTVPRYLFHCIPLPLLLVRQYDVRGDSSASTDEIETILKALYTKSAKELGGWADGQSFLKRLN